MERRLREPVNALTHLIGGALGIIGTLLLIHKSVSSGRNSEIIIGVTVFGLSMIALYFTSGIYHSVLGPSERILLMKKMDHSMIFVLIAGTYTPILMAVTHGKLRLFMMTLIWAIAITGILFRIFWIHAPRWLYTLTYVGMGWISVMMIGIIYRQLGGAAVTLLALGGISYTLGAVIYGMKRPNLSKTWGFHEIFHMFIMLGTLLHFLIIYIHIA